MNRKACFKYVVRYFCLCSPVTSWLHERDLNTVAKLEDFLAFRIFRKPLKKILFDDLEQSITFSYSSQIKEYIYIYHTLVPEIIPP